MESISRRELLQHALKFAVATSLAQLVSSLPPRSVLAEPTAPQRNWGDVLVPGSSWGGVDVYYNGEDPGYYNGDSGYGYRWQCVELVQRFYCQKIWSGYPTHWPAGRACEMYDNAPGDIQRFPNDGSSQAPRWGDALIFNCDSWSAGHAAVVTGVSNGRVYFVQQNVSSIGQDSLAINNNRIDRYGASGVTYPSVRGWLHSTRNGS